MVICPYFEITRNLETWFEKQVNHITLHHEKQANRYKNVISDQLILPIVRNSLTTGFAKILADSESLEMLVVYSEEWKRVFDFIQYLEVPMSVDLSLHRLKDLLIDKEGVPAFNILFQEVMREFSFYKSDIKHAVAKFSIYEQQRLNEAFHNLHEECYFSTVINAVVALEHRLLHLLKQENESYLKQKFKDDRFSLGDLIWIYLDKKEAFNEIIPKQHENLLKLCNDYRKISVHAKGIRIKPNIAESILKLTFVFLLDDNCCV